MKRIALLCAVLLTLAGCASTGFCDRASINADYLHASHLTAGPPFGPQSEEDWLDVASAVGRCESGRMYTEIGIGVSLTDGGFYGPDEIFTGRVGYQLWSRE